MPIIKFEKCYADLMMSIDLLKEFGKLKFVTIIEVINLQRYSGKANKLRYIYIIRGCRGTSPSRKGKLTISKSKSFRLSYIL